MALDAEPLRQLFLDQALARRQVSQGNLFFQRIGDLGRPGAARI
jgi:hypothetical protein